MTRVLPRSKFVARARGRLRDRFTWWDVGTDAPGRRMTLPEAVHSEFVLACYRLWDVEWDERWGAWPHCCTQGGCWMHCDSRRCSCRCRWCALALLLRGREQERRKKGKDDGE